MRFLVAVLIFVASSALAQSVIRFALLPSDVQTAVAGFDEFGRPSVLVQLTTEAGKRFERLTCANIGKQLELTVRDSVVINAKIVECIPNGRLQISGKFTVEETQAIARNLEPNQPQEIAAQPVQNAPFAQNLLEKMVNWFSELLKILFRR